MCPLSQVARSYLFSSKIPDSTVPSMSSTTEAGKAGIPGVHLTGDQIIQETTLQYLKALQDEWGIPGVSLAIVKMNEDKQWDKQTIGMGRKDVDGDRVTEQASCLILCATPLFHLCCQVRTVGN
jgi:hypothetical protein